MNNSIWILLAVIFVVITSMYGVFFYIGYMADNIANFTGHFVSLVVVPGIFGSVIGYLGFYELRTRLHIQHLNYWFFTIVGICSALIPAAIVYFALSMPHDSVS